MTSIRPPATATSLLAVRANVASDLSRSEQRIRSLLEQLRAEATERVKLELLAAVADVTAVEFVRPEPDVVDESVRPLMRRGAG